MKSGCKFILTISCLTAYIIFNSCALNSIFEPDEPPPDPPQAPKDLSGELLTASAESQGIDPKQLDKALQHADELPFLHSLLVVRNGFLIAEEYFGGWHADSLHQVEGATDVVIAALVGIALEQGLIADEFRRITQFLPQKYTELDSQKNEITLWHLLTMTSGLQWQEDNRDEWRGFHGCDDQVNYILKKPLCYTPGYVHNYSSGNVHLLSVILTELSGMSTLEYATQNLFEPLAIKEVKWSADSSGFNYGGFGLQLRPKDLAKLGVLYLQNGMNGNHEIVPSDWIKQTIGTHFAIGFDYATLEDVDFGYLWWIENDGNNSVVMSWGWGGQFVYSVPDRNLVIVTTARHGIPVQEKTQQEQAILDLLGNYIMPSVHMVSGINAN
jgi:CubicO group peptidase (beta-lactamase class C family)